MNLTQTQTLLNLGRAFSGESQARNRYTFYAEEASKSKYFTLSNLFLEIAGNEMAHAKVFFDFIVQNMPNPVPNMAIDAGYPFLMKDTLANLGFAANGEKEECEIIYPGFAQIAEGEGFAPIALAFRNIAKIEESHFRMFSELQKQMQDASLYRKATDTRWRCQHCGYMHQGTEPWTQCPVCGHPQGFVEPIVNVWKP